MPPFAHKKVAAIVLFSACSQAFAGALDASLSAERSLDLNISNSLISIENINERQTTHINDVTFQSPGTWLSKGSGQEHLSAIRSPLLIQENACASFYLAEDHIPLQAPAFCNANTLSYANIEQAKSIEVLRGPGTAFHGNSATHGVINILSPDFEPETGTALGMMYGSHDMRQVSIDHRDEKKILQLWLSDDQGYKDDAAVEQEKLRFKTLQSGDKWTLVHALNINNLNQHSAGYIEGAYAYQDASRKKENSTAGAFLKNQSLRFSSDLRLQPNDKSTFIFTPYLRTNNTDFILHSVPGMPHQENSHNSLGFQSVFIRPYSENIRLSSGFDFDYSRGKLTQSQQQAGPSSAFPQGEHYDYSAIALDIGMFIQVDAKLSEKWQLTTGLRLQDTRYNYDNLLSDGSACIDTENNCYYYRPSDSRQHFYNWSPHFSLQWRFLQKHYSYISLSRGFNAPHTGDLYRLNAGQILDNINSQKVDAAEWGFKGEFSQGRSYQLSAFLMEKDNAIFNADNLYHLSGQQTHHQGIELAINYRIIDALLFSATGSLSRHEYANDITLAGIANPEIKNNDIDSAPQETYQAQLTWLPTASSQLSIEGVYIGNYFLDTANDFSYAGHTLAHLRFQQQFSGDWTIQLALINALNEDYAEHADITAANPNTPSVERYIVGEPRNYRFSISKTF